MTILFAVFLSWPKIQGEIDVKIIFLDLTWTILKPAVSFRVHIYSGHPSSFIGKGIWKKCICHLLKFDFKNSRVKKLMSKKQKTRSHSFRGTGLLWTVSVTSIIYSTWMYWNSTQQCSTSKTVSTNFCLEVFGLRWLFKVKFEKMAGTSLHPTNWRGGEAQGGLQVFEILTGIRLYYSRWVPWSGGRLMDSN